MIDIELELFDSIVNEVEQKYPWTKNVRFINDVVTSQQKLPCVSIYERENRTYTQGQDQNLDDTYCVLDYEVNVYTNTKQTRRQEAREIMRAVDEAMLRRNFRRRTMENVPDLEDWSVYRLLARYTVIVGQDGTLYRRP